MIEISAELRSARVVGGKLGEVLEDAAVFDVVPTAQGALRLVGRPSRALSAVLATGRGAELLHTIESALIAGSYGTDPSRLHSVTLPFTNDAAWAVTSLSDLTNPWTGLEHLREEYPGKSAEAYLNWAESQNAEEVRQSAAQAAAWVRGGDIVFAPRKVHDWLLEDGLEQALDQVHRVTLHETQHALRGWFDTRKIDPAAVAWIEEGIAEALANAEPVARQRPGGLEMRNAYQAPLYATREAIIDRLLRMAGIDRNTESGFLRARELLTRGTPYDVPGNLAQAIIAAHGLDPAAREPLEHAIWDAEQLPDDFERTRTELGLT
jgi:hypothetical protein